MTNYNYNAFRGRTRLCGAIDSKALGTDTYTVSLLHMNGGNGETTFKDESGRAWSNGGGAVITTAQSVFGGASGSFAGGGNCLATPNTTDFQFGSGDFTIDFWACVNGSARMGILGFAHVVDTTYPDLNIEVTDLTHIKAEIYVGNGLVIRITSQAFSSGAFHHFAFIRTSNNFYLSVDGVLSAPNAYAGSLDYDALHSVTIGYQIDSIFTFNGWLDEVRISKGIARWTNNFTPPANEY